ncbi:hypothetical protein DAPPUDRAFT_261044 [Daphnia pulex]|uniref:Uncharacterized protein n=1 Tax=Daphnia pulex TaxID=6669 RepID=E9HKF7_DAPPU|nr:hypothetical protein DAPPUDRAFT_261044 [Daphnia pulex]|eukprot:EFX67779.1 hypothetical protein DAPPUDRAFT_261044 [Daphnia pulex]
MTNVSMQSLTELTSSCRPRQAKRDNHFLGTSQRIQNECSPFQTKLHLAIKFGRLYAPLQSSSNLSSVGFVQYIRLPPLAISLTFS